MNYTSIPFGKYTLGLGHPVCIVFEAGPTHHGLQSAKKLVDMAVVAGAHAIKFQMVNAKRLVPSQETLFTYTVLHPKNASHTSDYTEEITESLQEILLRRELSKEEWHELVAYCHSQQIAFFSTATFEDEVLLLHELGCQCIKICSGDINYHYLLKFVAQFDWIVQIDTGSASLGEVEQAVDVLEEAGCTKILINHCPCGYPASAENIHLRTLTTLKKMFPYPIAFSDHTPGNTMDVAAIALGVHMVEKTITLNKYTQSPEHIMSLEPHEALDFVQTVNNVEKALGSSRRRISQEEKNKGKVARRSIVAKCDIEKDTIITQEMLEYVRPENGLAAHLDYLILGTRTKHFIARGQRFFIN